MATTTGYQRWAVCMIFICSMITNGETFPTFWGNTPGTTEPTTINWYLILIVVFAFLVSISLILFVAVLCCNAQCTPEPKETTPINHERCQDYGLKAEIHSGGKKGKKICFASKDNFFSSLRLVAVAGNGDMVTFDTDKIGVMSPEYKKKDTFTKWASVLDKYVAVATSKRHPGEVLVAIQDGKIAFFNLSNQEEEIEGSRDHPKGRISDMDVDDMGNIYVADTDKNLIHTYDVNGSFKSTFTVSDFPQCISACDDGILYVLCRPKIKSDNGCDIEGVVIKRFKNGSRDDFDIKRPEGVNIVTTGGLSSSTTSLYVFTQKSAVSDEEASAILEFSATDGHFKRRIIDDWTGIRGMVFIRGGDELAFFDSQKVKVYERKRSTENDEQSQSCCSACHFLRFV